MDKRLKISLLSILLGASVLLSPSLELKNTTLFAVLIASAVYFGLYWILEFNVVGLRLIFVFLLPVIFNFLFAESIFNSAYDLGNWDGLNLIIALFFGFANYILILTANILNVASVKKIPLLQVAQTSLYFFTVFTCFLAFDALQSLEQSTVLDILILIVVLFVLIYQLLWFVVDSRKILFFTTLLLDLALVLTYFVLSFWPIPYLLVNLILSAVLYVLCGLVMHSAKKSLDKSTIFEYVMVLLIVIVITYYSLDWGIF
jgi:hypothetical protein